MNVKAIKFMMEEFGLKNRTKFFGNGQQVIEFVDSMTKLEKKSKRDVKKRQPIALILLDINMPILNGFETMATLNERFGLEDYSDIVRPVICYLTQIDGQGLKPFLAPNEVADYVLQKPMPALELVGLLKLLSIKVQSNQTLALSIQL